MTQDEALDLLKLGENVFLTGAAGAGKTWLLNGYIRYLREYKVGIAITASTGIAATHLNGRTLHSWSGIGVLDALTDAELEKLGRSKRLKRNYTGVKVLVIDEISMLHPHQLDMVDRIARRMLDSEKPFGGLQVVLCGDFFQLPPVSPGKTQPIKFAYESAAWASGGFRVCYLHEQHRQGDDPLLAILNAIRGDAAGVHTKVPLRTRYKREPEGNVRPTKLYARNINVDSINDRQLALLDGEEKAFVMESSGFSALVEGLKKTCLAPETLKLKTGAEVMFVKNAVDGSYVNGTRGVVTGFDKDEGWPVVRTFDDNVITAFPEEWKYEENGVIRAIIEQVPLRLAWAITIHKSQGMTLDAAEIDLGDAFEPGMGYVALSRVRSLNGLKLMNLNDTALQVHPAILAHDAVFKQQSRLARQHLQQLSPDEKLKRQQDMLLIRFNGNPDKSPGAAKPRVKKIPTHNITLEMLKSGMSLPDIARERGLKTGTILDHIEKLQGLGTLPDIDHLRITLPENDFKIILDEFRKSEDGKLAPIHQKLNGKYSYEDLRLVRLFVHA
ncbi:MAG TPA: helix-turn-helix domain-containing protein [Gammaproteobacteria bacterium]